MSWFKNIIAKLEQNWWSQAQYHLDNAMRNLVKPIPPKIPMSVYDDRIPVYIPNTENKNIFGFYGRTGNHVTLQTTLYAKTMNYPCFVTLVFDRDIENQLHYNEKAKSKIYHTDTIDGLDVLNANLTEATCVVQRRKFHHHGQRIPAQFKDLGVVVLKDSDATPYNIITVLVEKVYNDWDDNDDEFEEETPPEPQPSVGTPIPSLVGV